MSTLSVGTIQSSTTSPPTINNSAGTQIGTFCRAWVNFNGTGTPAARASFNVTSITDSATGDYIVTFTTALPDANYAVVTRVKGTDSTTATGEERLLGHAITRTTGNFRLYVTEAPSSSVRDAVLIDALIFR